MNSISLLICSVLSVLSTPLILLLGAQNGHFGAAVIGVLVMLFVGLIMGYLGERKWAKENQNIRLYRNSMFVR